MKVTLITPEESALLNSYAVSPNQLSFDFSLKQKSYVSQKKKLQGSRKKVVRKKTRSRKG